MATGDDLLRFDAVVKPLAGVVFAAAQQASVGQWLAVELDVRFSAKEASFIDKTRLQSSEGTVTSLRLSAEATLHLIALGKARPSGNDRWYGMLLRVTADGECHIRLNYDPSCAEDVTFFET